MNGRGLMPWTQKVIGSLLVIIAVAIGARVASMLLQPLLPWLYIALATVAVYWVLASWRQR